jgi:hypothetical protein
LLPSFVIIGAMRSGTTSLFRHLSEHPAIRFSATKETHFFDLHFDRGLDWYESQFNSDGAGDGIYGEATATYLYEPGAMDRLATALPDTKLVVSLRNPIDRAYSHYWLQRSRRRETLSFEDALAAEPERLAGASHRAPFAYLGCSQYLDQLRHVRELYPAEQLHVLLFEDLADDPAGVYAPLCAFLGVDPTFQPESLGVQANRHVEFRSRLLQRVAVRLPGAARRSLNKAIRKDEDYPSMDASTRARLRDEFAPHNAALANWLGRDLSVWDR